MQLADILCWLGVFEREAECSRVVSCARQNPDCSSTTAATAVAAATATTVAATRGHVTLIMDKIILLPVL